MRDHARPSATTFWDPELIDYALAEPEDLGETVRVIPELREHYHAYLQESCAGSEDEAREAFRLWSLSKPWLQFCAIVRIVSEDDLEVFKEKVRTRLDSGYGS